MLVIVSTVPTSSGDRLLSLQPCSSVTSLPQGTVLHELLQCESFPQAAALCALFQHGPPMGSQVLSADWIQCRLFSTWTQKFLSGACSRMNFPWGCSLLWASACSGSRLSMWIELCSTMELYRLQRHSSFTMVCSAGHRGITAPVPGAHPALLCAPTLVSAEFFCCVLSSSLLPVVALVQQIFILLKDDIPEVLPLSLRAQPWPVVGPSRSWLASSLLHTGEASGQFLQKQHL